MFPLQEMSDQPRQRHSGATDASWLLTLLDRFEKISQPDLRVLPCDERVLAALKAQLAQPALPRDGRDTEIRRQNAPG